MTAGARNYGIEDRVVLFTIACETCASRLNVKQEAAIGQVLACPKCGSMVLVQPPEGWQPPESEHPKSNIPKPPRRPDDSQATLSAEFGNLDRSSHAAANSSAPSANVPSPRLKSVVRKPIARQTDPTTGNANGEATVKTAPTINTAEKPQVATAPPVQPSVDISNTSNWEADGSGQRSNAKAWIAGIVGICLVALVLILYMVTNMLGGGAKQPVAQNDESTKTVETDVLPDNDDENKNDDASDDPGNTKGASEAENVDDNNDVDNTAANANATDGSSAKNADSETDTGTDIGKGDADSGNTDSTDPPADPQGSTPKTDDDSVLDIDAPLKESADPLSMERGEEKKTLLDELQGLRGLVPGIDMEEFRDALAEDQTHQRGIGKVYVPVPKARDFDFVRAAEEPYLGLAFRDQTLLDFSRNLFEIVQVPIQLDGNAITDQHLDPLAKVTAFGKEISAVGILDKALEPLGLAWQWNESKNVILITAKLSDEIAISTLDLAPALAIDSEDKANTLIEFIQSIVEPESWNTSNGQGSLKFQNSQLSIEQIPAITKRVENLVGRLTLAAQLHNSPDDPAVREKLRSAWSSHSDLLTNEGSLLVKQHEPILSVFQKLQRDDGLTLVADWNELAKNGWDPRVTIPWLSEGQTIQKTLKDLTNSMNLTFRFLDNQVIEITSRSKYQTSTRIEIYPCHQLIERGFTPVQIIGLLKEGVAIDLPRNQLTRVDYLPQYKCVVALLPDSLHVRTETLLNQLLDE